MSNLITHPYLQFRFWCPAAGCHVDDYTYKGKVDEFFQGEDILIAEQCTGLRDQRGDFVYENDLVSIQVDDKMPAWEGGVPVGDKVISGLKKRKVAFAVERDPACPSNLLLSTVSEEGIEIVAPVNWVKHGCVTGRIL